METKFNSQICTTREQSEKLIALGLKKETADMAYLWYGRAEDGSPLLMDKPSLVYQGIMTTHDLPAWSLHRLIEMMPRFVEWESGAWFYMSHDDVLYTDLNYVTRDFSCLGEIYNNVISAIEWLINEGYFNKEYLV